MTWASPQVKTRLVAAQAVQSKFAQVLTKRSKYNKNNNNNKNNSCHSMTWASPQVKMAHSLPFKTFRIELHMPIASHSLNSMSRISSRGYSFLQLFSASPAVTGNVPLCILLAAFFFSLFPLSGSSSAALKVSGLFCRPQICNARFLRLYPGTLIIVELSGS